jgi:hypothetical protein
MEQMQRGISGGGSGRVGRLAEMWKEAAALSRNCQNSPPVSTSAETLPGTHTLSLAACRCYFIVQAKKTMSGPKQGRRSAGEQQWGEWRLCNWDESQAPCSASTCRHVLGKGRSEHSSTRLCPAVASATALARISPANVLGARFRFTAAVSDSCLCRSHQAYIIPNIALHALSCPSISQEDILDCATGMKLTL